jgi:D-xylose 1-dehydrogenase
MAVYPSLDGKTVLITGGGDGIGAAMVTAFAWQGADVVFVDIDPGASERVAAQVTDLGLRTPRFAACDLRDVEASVAAVTSLLDGRTVHALVNNAGNDAAQPLDEVTVADWDDRVAVNLRHQFFLAQAVAPAMRKAKGGSIVNLGSISWMIGATGLPVYTTLKSAVSGLTKSLARELGGDGIRVNAIAPGWVLTKRQLAKGQADPSKFTRYLERQCLKAHLYPEHVAEMALWLCADESAMCTGQTLILDGGIV